MADFVRLAKPKNPKDARRAKALRKEAPLAERLLWEALRVAAKNDGLHFRRQYPIPPYIVDFACLKARLVVEIDGPSHDVRLDQDKQRDSHLRGLDYEVMRFTNEDVRENLENVVLMILNCALKRTTELYTPRP